MGLVPLISKASNAPTAEELASSSRVNASDGRAVAPIGVIRCLEDPYTLRSCLVHAYLGPRNCHDKCRFAPRARAVALLAPATAINRALDECAGVTRILSLDHQNLIDRGRASAGGLLRALRDHPNILVLVLSMCSTHHLIQHSVALVEDAIIASGYNVRSIPALYIREATGSNGKCSRLWSALGVSGFRAFSDNLAAEHGREHHNPPVKPVVKACENI